MFWSVFVEKSQVTHNDLGIRMSVVFSIKSLWLKEKVEII